MTKKKILIGALMGVVIAYVLDYGRKFGISREVYKFIAEPLFNLSVSLLIISTILLFVRDQIFHPWLKFAYWWLSASVLLVFLVPTHNGSLLPVTKEIVSLWMSGLFVFISIMIIIKKSLKLRKTDIHKITE